jgi:hypothetical protein
MKIERRGTLIRAFMILLFTVSAVTVTAQKFEIGIHADPLITWMSTNSQEYNSEGVKTGFSLGLNVLHYFDDNYAFSTGIGFINAGGRLSAAEQHVMVFSNFTEQVAAGDEMVYNLRYLNIPAGLRLRTNQVGYILFFTDLGIDMRVLLKSSVDLPGNNPQIKGEDAKTEVRNLNLGWHINAGIEYELGIKSSLVAGLGFDEDFFDVTKDLPDVLQPKDRSGLRMVRIRLGLKF